MRVRSARELLDRGLEVTLALLMLVMVAVVTWQIFTRFVLGAPASGTEELVRFALLWLSLLGASYGFGRGAHLAIDLLPRALGPRARRVHRAVTLLFIGAFAAAVLIIGGGRLAQLTLELGQASASLSVERGYVYLVLPLSGFIILLYVLEGLTAGEPGPAPEGD